MPDQLLCAKEMARFVADGYLAFPAIVPEALNREALSEFEDGASIADTGYRGTPFDERYGASAIGRICRSPHVAGIIRSLIGPDPIHDHHCLHVTSPRSAFGGGWHADATIDLKRHFDLQLMYFPHETPREMGGTMILPGSHFRLVHEIEVSRYQNFLGQRPTVCPAGTLLAVHHNLWHCSQPNHTDQKRLMFKIRLAATVPQVRLFDTGDVGDPDIGRILSQAQPWMGSDYRIEIINRIRLWRQLSGDPEFDCGYWVGRLENDPARRVARMHREAVCP